MEYSHYGVVRPQTTVWKISFISTPQYEYFRYPECNHLIITNIRRTGHPWWNPFYPKGRRAWQGIHPACGSRRPPLACVRHRSPGRGGYNTVQHRKYNTGSTIRGITHGTTRYITHVTAQEEQCVTFCVPVGALLQVQRFNEQWTMNNDQSLFIYDIYKSFSHSVWRNVLSIESIKFYHIQLVLQLVPCYKVDQGPLLVPEPPPLAEVIQPRHRTWKVLNIKWTFSVNISGLS